MKRLTITGLILAILITLGLWLCNTLYRSLQTKSQKAFNDMNRQSRLLSMEGMKDVVEYIKSGQVDFIDMFDAYFVDDQLSLAIGLQGLKMVALQDTDVTDIGMAHLSTAPDLERLLVISGNITDQGCQNLRRSPNLLHIALIGTKVTEKGLADLAVCPNLCTLTLDQRANNQLPPIRLSQKTIQSLRRSNIKKVTLGKNGAWDNPGILADFKKALPNAEIVVIPDPGSRGYDEIFSLPSRIPGRGHKAKRQKIGHY